MSPRGWKNEKFRIPKRRDPVYARRRQEHQMSTHDLSPAEVDKRIFGDLREVWGDLSGVWGDLTDVWGDLTGIRGDLTPVSGNLTGEDSAP